MMMRKLKIGAAIAVVALSSAWAREPSKLPADPPLEMAAVEIMRLVGITKGLINGIQGLIRMNQHCAAEFPASRICTPDEIMTTTVWPAIPAGAPRLTWVSRGNSSINCRDYSMQGINDSAYGLDLDTLRVRSDPPGSCSDSYPVTCCALVRSNPQSLVEVVIARRELAGEVVELF